ncbi:DUF1674 domain-containing protein [Ensifer soli]|uniref:DUF1674 domain-containing protein n=1 Tax=Ciceribacter sp. sgz301302 TaxID=3342379 RepID=UPI0035B90F0F
MTTNSAPPPESEPRRTRTAAAQRALKEAAERRAAKGEAREATEIGGRGGLDPARFGDWEINGRAIDF